MQTTKKIYFIVGEASGDLHGSNLMKAIHEQDSSIDFRFWGGDKMAEIAGKPVKHIKELAFMGFIEVIANLRTILGNIDFCKKDIEAYQPDLLVLIDYPGFNLRIAEWAKRKGIKVAYYISPQVWAWKQSRVHKIKRDVDYMYTILPFEKAFYEQFNYPVTYVGHPLLDAVEQYRIIQKSPELFVAENQLSYSPIIAVLPGSRKQEIKVKLPIMLEVAKLFPSYQFVVAGAPSMDPGFYQQFFKTSNCKIVFGKTYDLLSASEAAIVTSGTATLETALLQIPEVVCYKGSAISYHIAKRLVKIKYISLVNLIMDQEVVKELIQHECTTENIAKELSLILKGGDKREQQLSNYQKMAKLLGGGGASQKVAHELLKTIQ